jgi:hypothetical protein
LSLVDDALLSSLRLFRIGISKVDSSAKVDDFGSFNLSCDSVVNQKFDQMCYYPLNRSMYISNSVDGQLCGLVSLGSLYDNDIHLFLHCVQDDGKHSFKFHSKLLLPTHVKKMCINLLLFLKITI